MGLFVGGTPVKQVYVGNTPVKAVYVGADKIWPTTRETVRITLGTSTQARDQLRAALSDRGRNYQTVTEIPFDIELVGTGSAQSMFQNCSSLTSVPAMDTSQVTSMFSMFQGCSSLTSVPAMDTSSVWDMDYMFSACSSLTYVPDMDTGQVTDVRYMFYGCASLTDGNVRLIGRNPNVVTTGMIDGSGLTRLPFYRADGTPDDGIIIEVHEVSLTEVRGVGVIHPLLTVTVPVGETWAVTIEGTITKAGNNQNGHPRFRIGATTSDRYAQGAAVNFSGTISATDSTIAVVTGSAFLADRASFVGTVTIEK